MARSTAPRRAFLQPRLSSAQSGSTARTSNASRSAGKSRLVLEVHLRELRGRPVQPFRPRRRHGGRRATRKPLQPAVHLRGRRTGQDPLLHAVGHHRRELEPRVPSFATSPQSSSSTSSSTEFAASGWTSSRHGIAPSMCCCSTTSSSSMARNRSSKSSSTPSTASTRPASNS